MAKNPLLDLEDQPSSSCTNPEIAKKVKLKKISKSFNGFQNDSSAFDVNKTKQSNRYDNIQ